MSVGIEPLIEKAQQVSRWSRKLLDKAPLTEDQREDIVAIDGAAQEFVKFATKEMQAVGEDAPATKKREVRHQLRNYLNIIIGFSRLMVKELPDNLLMDMVTVRKIHDTGELLRTKVDEIQ